MNNLKYNCCRCKNSNNENNLGKIKVFIKTITTKYNDCYIKNIELINRIERKAINTNKK